MALEDGLALADALKAKADVTAALEAYEARRGKRCNEMVTDSRSLGKMEQVVNPRARFAIHAMAAVMDKLMPPEKMFADAFGYDP